MKASLPVREPEIMALWNEENVYERIMEKSERLPSFILHDGPPYANGHIHMGHAINKILKDIIIKYRSMQGKRAPYVPGWDCHGLPIEHQVDKELGEKKAGMSKAEFRSYCRKYAQKYVDIQREEFKRLGIFGDWDNPYLTMSYGYEAQIARELGRFMETGAVYQGKKPVYWCIDCKTALAEAEVEYADRKDPSITVAFPIPEDLGRIDPALSGKKCHVVIWTTTPWTIPSNLAVALGPDFEYSAYELPAGSGMVYILAKRLAPLLFESMGVADYKEIAQIDPAKLERVEARHPLYDRPSLIILGDHVTLDAGTGCVHTAPGHGQEDYEVGLRYGLEVFAPVNDKGCFTKEIPDLEGVDVFTANGKVVESLKNAGALLHFGRVAHSYPHCWRCKKPVIFRSTRQWFISMETTGLRKKALEEIDRVEWIPNWGRDRIYNMIAARPDWCISRQRTWGVPIVALGCEGCGETLANKALADKAADYFETEGADAWFTRPVSDFLPEGYKCPKCGGGSFQKEGDILDVWFDSGVSFAAVVEERPELGGRADLYLEGSDQHRGW
ncbi:isoleucine--tRNA ligase, partial [bacterium]